MTTYDFAPDVYAQFANVYKFNLNWPDRRPIASLILGTTAANWRTNPRGWLLDPTIDVTNGTGVKMLHDRVMNWAEKSIGIMRHMNAQGMITWDSKASNIRSRRRTSAIRAFLRSLRRK